MKHRLAQTEAGVNYMTKRYPDLAKITTLCLAKVAWLQKFRAFFLGFSFKLLTNVLVFIRLHTLFTKTEVPQLVYK